MDWATLASYWPFVLGLMVTGVVSGVAAGLLGIGGGAIIVPALSNALLLLGYDADVVQHVAVGTSLAIIIPTGIMSARAHYRRGALDLKVLKLWAPFIVAGTVIVGLMAGLFSGDVLPLLLARPSPERMTGLARSVFLKTGVDRCTWSDRPLRLASFEVDHIIPFALWGSNALWNLVPADRRVNIQKSDRLPTTELLLARRGDILRNWEVLRDALPEGFDSSANHLLGRKPGGHLAWRDELFGCLRQAIELTALQRGVERWAPVSPSRPASM